MSFVARTFERITGWVIRNAVLTLLIAMIAGGFGVWRAKKLKIDQDLKSLIPENYPSVERLEKLSDRIGSQSEFIVEIRCTDRNAAIRYGEMLASDMRNLENSFRFVEFKRNVQWFKDNALLYLPMHKLLRLRAKVIKRIRDEVESEVVESVDDASSETDKSTVDDDPIEMTDDEFHEKYGNKYDVPREYLEVKDDDVVVMVIRGSPIKGTTDVKFTRQLVASVKKLIEQSKPISFHPDLELDIRGEYAARSAHVSSIKSDLLGSTMWALGMLLLVIGFHFKQFRAIVIVLVPLTLSVLATLGVSTYMFDALNLVTAFIFVVLLGLGIDFGIHILSRYEYERMRGGSQRDSLLKVNSTTGVDVAAGAMTTAAMFSLFPIADFRGFSQFGAVACVGVILALLFTLTALPALIVVLEKISTWKPRAWLKTNANKSTMSLPSGFPARGLAISTLIVCIGLGGMSLKVMPTIEFEYDFSKLGKKSPPKSSSSRPKKKPKNYSDAIGRPDLGPAVALGESQEDGQFIEAQLRGIQMLTDYQLEKLVGSALRPGEYLKNNPEPDDLDPPELKINTDEDDIDDEDPFGDEEDPFGKEDDPFAPLIAEVKAQKLAPDSARAIKTYSLDRVRFMRQNLKKHISAWTFVPDRQEEKLKIIRDIEERIDKKYAELKDKTKEKVDDFRRYLKVRKPVVLNDVPDWALNRWTDNHGIFGRHNIIYLRGAKRDAKYSKDLYSAWFDLKPDNSDTRTIEVAANYFVLPEIIRTLEKDGPRVIGASLLAIFICLLLMFRSVRLTILILVPLMTSVIWLAGVFWWLEWKLNLYNVITFALIVGMGVDDGIHMVSRWVEDGQGPIWRMVRETGSAVLLTTVSTCIGFAGLLFSNHMGLSTLGWTAAVGMLLCLIASVTVLPALLYLLGRARS